MERNFAALHAQINAAPAPSMQTNTQQAPHQGYYRATTRRSGRGRGRGRGRRAQTPQFRAQTPQFLAQPSFYQQYQTPNPQFHNQKSFSQQHKKTQSLYYCWTHGVTSSPAHTLMNCRSPAPGHQPQVTSWNQMGRNTFNPRY